MEKTDRNNFGNTETIYQLFEDTALRFPSYTAVAFGTEQLTYNLLLQKVTALSRVLVSSVPDEAIIALSTTRSTDTIVAVLAILKAGKAYLPLDPAYPGQRLEQIITDSGVNTCICPPDEHSLFETFGLKILTDRTAEKFTDDQQHIQHTNAYVLYTSGSTGTPKGVYMTQAALVNLILWQIKNSNSGPGNITLQFAPLSFDVSFQEIFSTLAIGATLLLISDDLRLDPIHLLEYIEVEKVDRIFLPFVALQFLAEAATSSARFPSSIKEVMTAGEQLKITPQVKDFFLGLNNCTLYNQYGPTECHVVTQLVLAGNPESWPLLPNIGTPIANTSIYILDDKYNVLPAGSSGELGIAGLCLADGYLNKPELTAQKFVTLSVEGRKTRVYLTGDLAQYLEDGTIEFLGRRDDQVKIRGYRIELGEIEIMLNGIPGIKQAIVIAQDGKNGQKRLLAYLVAADKDITHIAVRKHLEEKLPDYMIPSAFIWMEDLPKTPSGKVDKKALPIPERKRPELSVPFKTPKSEEEKKIAAVWASVLDLDKIGVDDNFFELGGNSLLALKTISELRLKQNINLPITKLYQFPVISQILNYLGAAPSRNEKRIPSGSKAYNQPVAVIGMAGKFPGADTIEELWEILRNGRETTTFFKDEELDQSIPDEVKKDASYVRARGILRDVEMFDAGFFGINPKLAELMDPQQRLFLEISRDVLEKSGHLPDHYKGTIGVFAGCGNNSYYHHNVLPNTTLINNAGSFQVMTVNEKDYISSRTAFQLDLKGPAVSVFSACSTSLLAIAQAVESLRKNQCDVAIAGGASITSPIRSGHLYQDGAMLSQDGHCRSFDEKATGTVFSDGAGVVLLKTLNAALADGDTIYGLIKGVGINNDGAVKSSFTAPSIDGQAAAISMAIQDADIDPVSITYVEAHGTATPLGDPIEIEGLKQAFGEQAARQYCAIGSIKSNMGHMTAAAGVAGLIKTMLALYHKEIPPSINFNRPNPNIDFEHSPFYVNHKLKPWDIDMPRRAGISSFGVGGTNVHLVVEEHSHPLPDHTSSGRVKNLFTWSAKSAESLQGYTSALRAHLETSVFVNLADVAHTLQTTRTDFSYRRFAVADSSEELKRILDQPASASNFAQLKELPGETVFLFPGQGAQYLHMGAELYRNEAVFRSSVDVCAEILTHYVDKDIRKIIYPDLIDETAEKDINNTRYTQPALFVIAYALAKLWMSWGIQPSILCGHSIGEYVAAHLAGVFSLEDGLKIIAKRGQMVSNLSRGSMLSIRSDVHEIEKFLPETLSVSAVNSHNLCVVAGTDEAINNFQQVLDQQQILHRKLLTSHAFHSYLMDPVLPEFASVVSSIQLNRPQKPIVSTVTGNFLTDAEAQDPAYWTEHLRHTVQFSKALDTILQLENPVLIETGPGNVCTTLAFQHSKKNVVAVSSLDNKERQGSYESLLKAMGKIWLSGLNPDWNAFYSSQQRRRTGLPTYSYHKKKCWIEPANAGQRVINTTDLHPPKKTTDMRTDTLIKKIKQILEDASGIEMDRAAPDLSFIEIGLDSLLLTQVALTLKKEFAIPITFRQLNEEYGTMTDLATYINSMLPQEPGPVPVQQVRHEEVPQQQVQQATAHTFPAPADSALGLIAQQLQLLSKQVQLMTNISPSELTPATSYAAREVPYPVAEKLVPDTSVLSAEEQIEIQKPFGATARIERKASALDSAQRIFLEKLTSRYNAKTAKSKAFAQKNRAHMADPRVVSGFKPYTKEIVYPIVTHKSSGSHLWDIDGNEYIDALNGFGSNLLGYQSQLLKDAILSQIEKGYEIGPQHELAGEVSKLICEFTGFDRAALCNTGSEAVLGAMRIARTVTGRSLIVAFSGSYHGINDEVIIRGSKKLKSFPAAPGILPEAVQNMLILDYGTAESLEIIRERAHELAAVLVEPVQSRRPEFQPVDFLKELRKITEAAETALIFDEVITGFRAHPGGTQALFDIRADLGTYGKVIGGGLPIGAIAGKKRYMDALDGGFWQYGDDSFPEVGVTYFAGTFVRHPLALATAKASLEYMKTRGPKLQEELNANTAYLAAELNKVCTQFNLPIMVAHFGSLWKIKFKEEYPYAELLFTLMREKGIHIWEGFPCFLTTAHTLEEINLIISKFQESISELLAVNLIPVPNKEDSRKSTVPSHYNSNTPPVPGAILGKDQLGNPAWFVNDVAHPGKYLQIDIL